MASRTRPPAVARGRQVRSKPKIIEAVLEQLVIGKLVEQQEWILNRRPTALHANRAALRCLRVGLHRNRITTDGTAAPQSRRRRGAFRRDAFKGWVNPDAVAQNATSRE